MATEEFYSQSVAQTEEFGAKLAKELVCHGGLFFIALEGDLGAGKTAFCRGVASVISPGSRVKSPSYTIVNEYRMGEIPLFHFDLYRLGEDCDLSEIGFTEYTESGHCIVEWSEYMSEKPKGAVTVTITKKGEECRLISVSYGEDSL